MICPSCGGSDLVSKKKFASDPYDYSKQRGRGPSRGGKPTELEAKYYAEQRAREEKQRIKGQAPAKAGRTCSLCGFSLSETWNFCPECGISLTKK